MVCHSVVVLIFRKLLERLSEQRLLTIDGDKAQEVRNCSVTHYEFDPSAGTNGKLILRDFNRVYCYEAPFVTMVPFPAGERFSLGESLDART